MPVKIWDRDADGRFTSRIKTDWRTSLSGEEYRAEAEDLDTQLDRMLDRAAELGSANPGPRGTGQQFVKRWAIGRAVAESRILQSPQMASEQPSSLWLALARKCRLGVRSSGEPDERWRKLIPDRDLEPHRIERDIFAAGLWLQEQALEEAFATFGGSLSNVRQIQRRESLRSTKLRSALGRWFLRLSSGQRSQLIKDREFAKIAKALQRRWPSRGPGSAKRPVHFTDRDLDREVSRVLAEFGSAE